MSATKKNITKSATSPASATKSAAAKSSAIKKTAVVPTVRATAKTPVAMLAPNPARAVTPAVIAARPKPVKTTITARVDVGFGNVLFVRGEGAGLGWDKGMPMENISADTWQITLGEGARAYTFKLLINDVTWSAGPDFTAACGTSVTLTPEF